MMRSDALNVHVYPVITETTGMKHIPILHVCSTDKSELEDFLVGGNVLQVYSTDNDKSKGIIADESSMEERKSECVH